MRFLGSSWLFWLPAVSPTLAQNSTIHLSLNSNLPPAASQIVPRDFVSLSIEFAFWVDFAGNKSRPNDLTAALLANLRTFTATEPILRIGGITQDQALYVPTQKDAVINVWNYRWSEDRPESVMIGPGFWDSFDVQNNSRYIFGLNFAREGSDAVPNLQNEVNVTLSRIPSPTIHSFELGNEIDAYSDTRFRSSNWTQFDYVAEWVYKTGQLNLPAGVHIFAPSYSYLETGSPSFFSPFTLWNDTYNYDPDHLVTEVSQHGYFSTVGKDITLQGTLMNHTAVIDFVEPFAELSTFHRENGRLFTIGETNSIAGQGSGGVSDVFGAALWTVDYALYAASQNISRMHFHQGTSYRYGAWQPITANETSQGVRPPYYGLAFVSKFLGPSGTTQISNIDLSSPYFSAYAAYESGKLSRIALVNLLEYNSTVPEADRPRESFTFKAPLNYTSVRVESLTAPHATSNSSITLARISYDNRGLGAEVSPPAFVVQAHNGEFKVSVGASEASVLTFI